MANYPETMASYVSLMLAKVITGNEKEHLNLIEDFINSPAIQLCDISSLIQFSISWIQNQNDQFLWLKPYGYKFLSMIVGKHRDRVVDSCSEKVAEILLATSFDAFLAENRDLNYAIGALSDYDSVHEVEAVMFRTWFAYVKQKCHPDSYYDVALNMSHFPEDQDDAFLDFFIFAIRCVDSKPHDQGEKPCSKTTDENLIIKARVYKRAKLARVWLESDRDLYGPRELRLLNKLQELLQDTDVARANCRAASLLPLISRATLEDFAKTVTPQKAIKITGGLLAWLHGWPQEVAMLTSFSFTCLKRIEDFNQPELTVSFAAEYLPKLFSQVCIPFLHDHLSGLILYLLLSTGLSDEPLKKLLENCTCKSKYIVWFKQLPNIRKFVKILVGVCYRLADKHPHLEEQVNNAFEDVIMPTQEELNSFIQNQPWFGGPMVDWFMPLQISVVGPRGLTNLGNTCYMNSTIQALYFTHRFRRRVLLKDSNSLLQSKQLLMFALQKLLCLLSYSPDQVVIPSAEFTIPARPPGFIKGHQEDCSEFLVFLLNTLHEQEQQSRGGSNNGPKPSTSAACGPVVKKEPKSPVDTPPSGLGLKRWTTEEDLSDDSAALLNCRRKARSLATFDEAPPPEDKPCSAPAPAPPLTDIYSDSKDSGIHSVGSADIQEDDEEESQPETLVRAVFGGTQTMLYSCIACGFEYKTVDKFLDLQLALPARHNLNIQDLITYFLQPENMMGDNQYLCRGCNRLQDATRTISIEKAPEHLILTIKRFHYEASRNQIEKLMVPVECSERITLPTLRNNQEYELFGIVLHTGSSPHSGHYHTQIKVPDHSWLWLNDEAVTTIPNKSFGSGDTPYVLFYRQRNLNDDCLEDPPLTSLSVKLQNDILKEKRSSLRNEYPTITKHKDNGPPPPPPPAGGCGEHLGASFGRYVC